MSKLSDPTLIGGYFSYGWTSDSTRCIFYTKDETPQVLATVTFDSSFAVDLANTHISRRPFIKQEKEIFDVKKRVVDLIYTDSFFNHYNNTGFNTIPVIGKTADTIYVLTAPKSNGVIIMGNDYQVVYDKKGKLLSKHRMHQSLLAQDFGKAGAYGAMHTHLEETGDLLTPTEVCTLLLYGTFTGWKTYGVVGKNYVTTWDFETRSAITMPTQEFIKKHRNSNRWRLVRDALNARVLTSLLIIISIFVLHEYATT